MHYFKSILLTLLVVGFLAGCATVGQPYAEHQVNNILVGKTSRAEIRAMFGEPWRTGLESGQRTWTYAHYQYSVFSDAQTSDLVIRYNQEGRVASYTFNRTSANPTHQKKSNQVGP